MDTIFTHGGTAHRDEFLACCVILACTATTHAWRIARINKLTQTDIAPTDYVVDIGGKYDPLNNRFDHHHSRDLPCSLSLVLTHFNLQAAYEWYPWLEFTDIIDTRGAQATAAWLDTRVATLARTRSPVETALLSEFGRATEILAGSTMHAVMMLIGRDIVEGLTARIERMALLMSATVLEYIDGKPFCIYFLEDVDNPDLCMRAFRSRVARGSEVYVTVDKRGSGWQIVRFDDGGKVDFTAIKDVQDVAFVHNTGFLATTSARVTTSRLKELIHASIRK
jgi:hypothetical protein